MENSEKKRGRTSGLGKLMFRTSTSPWAEQIIAGVSPSLNQITSSSPSIVTGHAI